MLEELKSTWSSAMTREEFVDFCHRMTEKRRGIRQTKGIKPPRMRCPKCGQASRSGVSGVSIRSALFALKNNGVVTAAEFKEPDRKWMRHKAKHGLNPYGRKVETPRPGTDSADPCC
jgi:hypothetical protein